MEPQPVHSYHAQANVPRSDQANVPTPHGRATGNSMAMAWIEWLGHSALVTKALLSAEPQPDSNPGACANSESHSAGCSSAPDQPPE